MDLMSRKQRATTENIYLVDALERGGLNERAFVVMGTSQRPYTVTIKKVPECTCPDNRMRKKRCKHIYFVLMKIMKVRDADVATFSDRALVVMFKNQDSMANVIINKGNVVSMKNATDDVCPVCLDDLTGDLDYCKYSCGKPIHKVCFSMWTSKKQTTCVFCNADWFTGQRQ